MPPANTTTLEVAGSDPMGTAMPLALRDCAPVDHAQTFPAATWVFAATAFLSAGLLFGLQPIVARAVIPALGGAPSVWTTCVLFFQGALLLGYLYAHLLGRAGGLRVQAVAHAAVLVAAAALLPASPGESRILAEMAGADATHPVGSLLRMLTVSVGPAAFAISATGPLVQAWLARGPRVDPYHVYAFSNAGSLLALIAYPMAIEPYSPLPSQFAAWTRAYWLFVAGMALCAVVTLRSALTRESPARESRFRSVTPAATRFTWVILAAIPSSLMLGVTSYLSTDIAAIPLLWVVPCALYLLTLIASFSRHLALATRGAALALPIVVPALLAQTALAPSPAALFMGLQLIAFVVAATACHAALAARRPPAQELTGFYVWIAVGGVLGGAINTVLAPAVFASVVEYPLMLLAGLVIPSFCFGRSHWRSGKRYAVVAASGTALCLMVLLIPDLTPSARMVVAAGVPLALCFASRHPAAQAGVVAALLAVPFVQRNTREDVLFQARSFFGVHRVLSVDQGASRVLQHGTTVHGRQMREWPREPAGYYQRAGPFGDVDAVSRAAARLRRVGVAGLGSGILAAYANPSEDWTFFEIDPVVERIARTDTYFTYLRDCGAPCRVVLGDARVSLRAAAADAFDLLAFDVFSSDAIPTHLLTREAIAEYKRTLRPGGLMAFHISNRYLRLAPVVHAAAAANGLASLGRSHRADAEDQRRGGLSSEWVVMAESPGALAPLAARGWIGLPESELPRAWTDTYSNVLGVVQWRRAAR